MGYELVALALATTPPELRKEHPRALIVLVTMAAYARDTDSDDQPAGVYFAGWGPLAISLGYTWPAELETGGPGRRSVYRQLDILTAYGVVKRDGRARYRLTFGLMP